MGKYIVALLCTLIFNLGHSALAHGAESHIYKCKAPPKWMSGNTSELCAETYTISPGQELFVRQDLATDSDGDIASIRYEAFTEGDEQPLGRRSLQGTQSGVLWRNTGDQHIRVVIRVIANTFFASGFIKGAFMIR